MLLLARPCTPASARFASMTSAGLACTTVSFSRLVRAPFSALSHGLATPTRYLELKRGSGLESFWFRRKGNRGQRARHRKVETAGRVDIS
jgi:hypothetical protein